MTPRNMPVPIPPEPEVRDIVSLDELRGQELGDEYATAYEDEDEELRVLHFKTAWDQENERYRKAGRRRSSRE